MNQPTAGNVGEEIKLIKLLEILIAQFICEMCEL